MSSRSSSLNPLTALSVDIVVLTLIISLCLTAPFCSCRMLSLTSEGEQQAQATPTPPLRVTATPAIPASATPTPPPRVTAAPVLPASATPTFPLPSTSTPTATPSPTEERLELADWPDLELADWPRPAGDNGMGIHFMKNAYFNDDVLELNIARAVDMNMKWALVLYADGAQLERAARRFKEAGMVVVWRPRVFAYEHYPYWERDVRILQEMGLPPYIQVYNEPSMQEEWQDGPRRSGSLFRTNLRAACRDVYNAGGFVGLQFIHEKWLIDSLRDLKKHGGERIFKRMFFLPHPYGMNHPPSYTEDPNGVLGFRYWADILRQELGFVPPMIVGEGGWKYGAENDNRFPKVNDELHRDYHVEMFNWFRTEVLSNGEPLPDYLFAVCPWLISAELDSNAWYDSFAGERTLTIEAVKAIPLFERKFSWER